MSLRRAPARNRSFAFEALALDDAEMRQQIWREALEMELDALAAPIRGSDRDEKAVVAMEANCTAAGLHGHVEIAHESVSDAAWLSGSVEAPARGALVCNPPFGLRLSSDRDVRALWQTLGRLSLRLPVDWRVALLAEDRELAYSTGLALKSAFLTEHGGRKVHAFVREEDAY
jgi:putative N6-adenine-specific DNA methylase